MGKILPRRELRGAAHGAMAFGASPHAPQRSCSRRRSRRRSGREVDENESRGSLATWSNVTKDLRCFSWRSRRGPCPGSFLHPRTAEPQAAWLVPGNLRRSSSAGLISRLIAPNYRGDGESQACGFTRASARLLQAP